MAAGSGKRRTRRALTDVGPPVAVFVGLVGAWHGFVVVRDPPTVLVPSPLEVGAAAVALAPTLAVDAAVTGATAALGLGLGFAVGVALAFAMVRWDDAALVLKPVVVALRIAPLVAIAPLVLLWFGDGVGARALLVSTMTVFPVAVASVDGLRATPRPYLDLVRTVDAPARRVFLRVRVVAAAPSVVAGCKLAASLSVIGAVVAEFLTLESGLGYRLFVTSNRLDTPSTFAALAVLSVLGAAFYVVPLAVERRLWGR